MLTDAGDESAIILRAQDRDQSDPAETAFLIAQYVRRIQTLFIEGACCRSGFTEVMLETLSRPMVYTVRGHPLQCGARSGVPAEVVASCLDRMKCWSRMAIAVAGAEFPDYTILYAMSAFRLVKSDLAARHTPDSVTQAGDASITEKLQTLATAFHVGEDELAMQFANVRDLAQAVLPEHQNNERSAWRAAATTFEVGHWKSYIGVAS